MLNKNLTIIGLLCLVLVAILAWPATAVELYIAGGQDGFQDDLADWQALYPDIKLNWAPRWQDDSIAKVMVMIAAGTPPDLLRLGPNDIPRLAHMGVLEDLTPYIDKSSAIKRSNLLPINDLYVLNGKQYALNKDWSADGTMFYNKQMFAEAGLPLLSSTQAISYDELRTLCQRLQAHVKGTRGDTTGFYGYAAATLSYVVHTMLIAAGEPVYTEDHKQAVLNNRPAVKEIAEYWVEMSQRGFMGMHAGEVNVHTGFPAGKVGIVSQGYYWGARTEIQGFKDNISVAPLAAWKGQRVNYSAAVGFAICAQSKHKAEAWKALEWLVAGKPATNRAKTGWGMPPLRSLVPLLPQETEFDRVRMEATLADLPYVQPLRSNIYNQTAISGHWNTAFDQARKGNISIAQMIDTWERDTNASLAAAMESGSAK